jgi:DNA-binding beta-propeller fold protein YncE
MRPLPGGIPAAACLLAALVSLLPGVSVAEEYRRWRAERRGEVTGAEGIPFNQPADVVLYEGGMAVLDSLNNRLCLFDRQGRHQQTLRGSGEAPLTGSLGVARDYRGVFYVTDALEGRILALAKGSPPRVLKSFPRGEGGRRPEPAGILFYDQLLFITDRGEHTVWRTDVSDSPLVRWGTTKGGVAFKFPFRLASDPRGAVAVVDVLDTLVHFFTPKGEFLSSFGRPGTTAGTLFRPAGFAIDRDGRVWLADNYFGTVQVFTAEGRLEALLHDPERKPLLLRNPVSLAVEKDLLAVLETGAGRLTLYTVVRD